MTRGLLLFASLLGLSKALPMVLSACSCATGGYETFPLATAAYCPTTSYPCNSSLLAEADCTLTCPQKRNIVTYRNGTATWLSTKSLTCSNGVLTNANGVTVTNLMRPTCGIQALCDNCPMTYEATACPAGSTCNPDNYKKGLDAVDQCDRIWCDNSATLTIYDENKTVVSYTANKLYCSVANKWYNYSMNGGTSSGVNLPVGTYSANCRLPASCETCLNPTLITSDDQLPEAFRTGYSRQDPTVTRPQGQCSTVTCPNGWTLMGFVGTGVQNGTAYTNKNKMLCASTGLWTNDAIGYTPQDMKATCMQKNSVCPAPDVVAGSGFTVACDEVTKVSSLTCPTGQKLTLRYTTIANTVKYDRATFFAGKGWLAHGCDATASLFTTASGQSLTAVCSAA